MGNKGLKVKKQNKITIKKGEKQKNKPKFQMMKISSLPYFKQL